MEALHTISERGYRAEVYPDFAPESPRDWAQVGTLAYSHRHAGEGDMPAYWSDYGLSAKLVRDFAPDATHVLPVYSYDDREGTVLQVSESWDRATGFIYATAESIAETVGADATGETIIAAMTAELVAWQQWAQGDVYGVAVLDPDGETVDSCWGFYGMEYAEQQAESMLVDVLAGAPEQLEMGL